MAKYFLFSLFSFFLIVQGASAQPPTPETQERMSPLMERYVFDELKALRSDFQALRVEMKTEIVDRELDVADRATSYVYNSATIMFYVLAIGGGILALVGWRSISELKAEAARMADKEIGRLSEEYESRLSALENELNEKGQEIFKNQQEIEKTQAIHAIWLQAQQAVNPRARIELYDRILGLSPGDLEVMAYKADAALQLGERDWALSLCNRILEENPDMALAYYQRACALAGLGEVDGAFADLEKAIDLSHGLREQARVDEEFSDLREDPRFETMTQILDI